MTSICFSIASNLRCSDLTLAQSNALLVIPTVDLVFCFALLKAKWGDVQRHQWSLIIEIITYIVLVVFDYVIRERARYGIDPDVYLVYDKAIGVLTIFPIFFYTISLLLLSRADILPLTSSGLMRRILKFCLIVFIPLILLFNELAGLVGGTYVSMNGQIFVGYSSAKLQGTSYFLSSVTTTLLGMYQWLVGAICLFYIFRARSRGHGGGVIPGFTFVAIGLFFGTTESLMGLGMATFGLIVTRKVFRTLARASLVTGMIVGTSSDEASSLSLLNGAAQEPEKPRNLRDVISNPHSNTFARLSPSATAFHAALSRSHRSRSVGRYQDDLERQSSSISSMSNLVDARVPIENIPSSNSRSFERYSVATHTARSASFHIVERNGRFRPEPLGVPHRRSHSSGIASGKIKTGFTPFRDSQLTMLPRRRNKPGDRVTVDYDGDDYTKPPVLQLRLSDLSIPSVGAFMGRVTTPDRTSVLGQNSHGEGSDRVDGRKERSGRLFLTPDKQPSPARSSSSLPSTGRRFQYPGSRSNNSSAAELSDPRRAMREIIGLLPSVPDSARTARLSFTRMSAALAGGNDGWAKLGDDLDTAPLPEPMAPFRRDEVASDSPRSSRSQASLKRSSETESLWFRTGNVTPTRSTTPRPLSKLKDRESGLLTPQTARSRPMRFSDMTGSRYDEESEPGSALHSAQIVEATSMNMRAHWSTTYAYRGKGKAGVRGSEQLSPVSYHSSETIKPGGPSTPQAAPPPSPGPEPRRHRGARAGPSTGSSVGHNPSLSEQYRGGLAGAFLSDQDHSTETGEKITEQSAEDAVVRVRGYGKVVARNPTITESIRERESVTLEHGQTPPADDPLEDALRRYSFPREDAPAPENISSRRSRRQDSGVLGKEDEIILSRRR
ncbi:hypothetical protein FRB99_008983 [Tulasnella sp. 403]|nr:hypothetical protein FRB99_008983 [Tulasnella sp. 403]